jgi:hypothetical protein
LILARHADRIVRDTLSRGGLEVLANDAWMARRDTKQSHG